MGHGYVPEAVTALLRLGFEELKLHRIYAECHPDNRASYRLMEKVGMRREGYLRASHWEHDEWWTCCSTPSWSRIGLRLKSPNK